MQEVIVQYGIYLPNFGCFGNVHTLVQLAREAEEAGWDGFFLWDHIAGWQQDMVDPWVALAAIATQTERIRIGTTVTPLPRRRPWKLARESVSLDRLSNGRLILGVGSGGGGVEFEGFGEETDAKQRGAMLDEALEVLTGLWSGEPFSYTGQHYQVAEVQFTPTPLQSPRIPIWVGGFWPNKPPFRRAACWDGLFPLFAAENEAEELTLLQAAVAYTQEHRTSQAPFDVIALGLTPGDGPEKARGTVARYAAAGATWWLEAIAPFRFGVGFDAPEWPLEELRRRVLQGPPK
jgi:alkanesulfonate monooxygenase SsuD/methylene tetrahydromethanopterin reductase-like flavin-dependent oxidoreductase (luciferase family)